MMLSTFIHTTYVALINFLTFLPPRDGGGHRRRDGERRDGARPEVVRLGGLLLPERSPAAERARKH